MMINNFVPKLRLAEMKTNDLFLIYKLTEMKGNKPTFFHWFADL